MSGALVEEVVRELGGRSVLGAVVRSQAGLASVVRNRLPLRALEGLARAGLRDRGVLWKVKVLCWAGRSVRRFFKNSALKALEGPTGASPKAGTARISEGRTLLESAGQPVRVLGQAGPASAPYGDRRTE